ncbi:hypothetical protein ACFVYA_37165 [Amycolatopsis sp. NPDC058278]|uniref:hypothetical protein n=1 Tax=Amycolatopsis sp. NPDC058278 TaxID=3346417 RepID=UPI0036D8EACA
MRRLGATTLLLLALLAACDNGGSAPGAGPTTSARAVNSMADFAKCMREHGQNVPDPDPNSGEQSLAAPDGASSQEWNAAMRACGQLLPNGGAPQAPDQQELDGLRAYAACMREHGIEASDPDPDTGRITFGGRLADADRAELRNDPGYQAAQQACEGKLAEPKGKGK